MLQVVVIGGDACGASAASSLKRALRDDVHVIVLERQPWTSYSACGIPYWIAGDVAGPDGLVMRSPQQHRANGLDVRTGWEAIAIDLQARAVQAVELASGDRHDLHFDHLVIATGAEPLRPPVPGIDLPGVHRVHTLDDGLAILDSLGPGVQHAVVVGAGYIGIEMAEAMSARGLRTAVVDLATTPMSTLDADMGERIAQAMADLGIAYYGGAPVEAFEAGPHGRVARVVAGASRHDADVVLLGLGVRPNSSLADAAGLPIGERGGILTDDRMRVSGQDAVWAGGDCVEVVDRITGRRLHVALGTHANKHGRVIGTNIAGGDLVFPGIVGTAVSKICDLEVARVGLRESEARELGFDVVAATIVASTRAHYFPTSGEIRVKVIAERGTGRMLGCQIVGMPGSGKRIDVAAAAIWSNMTVEEVTSLDLAYAPPFSPVWDPVQIAARKVASQV